MSFVSDKQTLEDLAIFGSGGKPGVAQLFDSTRTRGGASVLSGMFRYPLGHAADINHRSQCFRFFKGVQFEFLPELFDAAESYLSEKDERTRLAATAPDLKGRVAGWVGGDSLYKLIAGGVSALGELFVRLRGFGSRLGEGVFSLEASEIAVLLDALGTLPSPGWLSYEDVVHWDGVFRWRHRGTVEKLLGWLYVLDVYISVGALADRKGMACPVAIGTGGIRIEGLYHPLLENPVQNSIMVEPDQNVLFLTGANMAGKSTFMKSMGIALYLGHMGFPVPASAMEFRVFDGIYTTINLADSLNTGASHFYSEVLRIKKVARELRNGKDLFVVFDELFRGTNVKDAYEGTVAVTERFALRRNSVFVLSTHIVEAGEELRERVGGIRFVFMPTRMEGTRPVYSYRLEEGITEDRHGMIIINNEGIPQLLAEGVKNRRLV
jgi:DNA mismatch repair protein MutS